MSKFTCNIKYMYRANTCHKFILVVTDKVPNYLVTIPLYRRALHEVREALINHMFYKHGSPFYFIFDEDQVFTSSVMQYIYKR